MFGGYRFRLCDACAAPVRSCDGSGGRHDNHGSALSAQPGESQRRPATNTSSQLIQCIGLPAPSCSRCLCPGWSHHTLRSSAPQPDIGTENHIPATKPIERLNGEIKRRTEVVGIVPNDDAIVRLVGALLLEQNDEWAVQRSRYLTLETIAAMSDDPLISLPAAAS